MCYYSGVTGGLDRFHLVKADRLNSSGRFANTLFLSVSQSLK